MLRRARSPTTSSRRRAGIPVPGFFTTVFWAERLTAAMDEFAQAEHVGHHDVRDREVPGEPLAPFQHRLHMAEARLDERVELLDRRGVRADVPEFEQGPGEARHLDRIQRREQPFHRLRPGPGIGREERRAALAEPKRSLAITAEALNTITSPASTSNSVTAKRILSTLTRFAMLSSP